MSEPSSVKLALSIFTNITESLALPAAFSRSPRNCQQQSLVGLGIVAAMNDAPEQGEARIAISPRSSPIPILSARPGGAKLRGGTSTAAAWDDDQAASEGYTCVISRHGEGAAERKREYFDRPGGAGGDWSGSSGLFWPSPTPGPAGGDGFLSACYLCRKRLHGLDIFMYRGEKAFCSVECRYQQILSDELKENCGSEALKSPFDCAASPCSVPRLFSAGVAAA